MPRSIDLSPPQYTGPLDPLDRSLFQKSIEVIAVRVAASKTSAIARSPILKNFVIRFPKISPIVHDSTTPGGRLVILNIVDQAELSTEAAEFLAREAEDFVYYALKLDYDFWTAADILRAVLPEELMDGAPVGFAATGHIAHLNLNAAYRPYKKVIGQVFLDKNKSITTVVNKLSQIDTQFRFFQMELLAGEPDFIVTHAESQCRFTFDFSKVYWNSRLHTEHERIVKMLNPSDVLADVFAGVGPFAVPAAKHGCAVLANDLNPNSAKYLAQNVKDNDVSDLVRVTCEDGRQFVRAVFRRTLVDPFPPYTGPKLSKTRKRKMLQKGAEETLEHSATSTDLLPRDKITQLVMNLPDSAIDFLDAFRGVLSTQDLKEKYTDMPMVHCHCFTRELEEEKAHVDIIKRVEEKLGCVLSGEVSLFHVRSVAPGKEMYCISFRLPRNVAVEA